MSDKASDSVIINAPAEEVLEVINDLDSYPEWSDDIKSTQVLDTDDQGRPVLVRFDVDVRVAEVEYVLRYDHSAPNVVSWTLEDSEVLNMLDGSYALDPRGEDETKVTYTLEADIAIPVPGFLKKRATKTIMETGLKGLKRRVEQG